MESNGRPTFVIEFLIAIAPSVGAVARFRDPKNKNDDTKYQNKQNHKLIG